MKGTSIRHIHAMIQRLAPDAFPPQCEYLSSVHPVDWSTDRTDALIFENTALRTGYEVASDTIDTLKALGHLQHAHPVVCASPEATDPDESPLLPRPELQLNLAGARDWRVGIPNCGVE